MTVDKVIRLSVIVKMILVTVMMVVECDGNDDNGNDSNVRGEDLVNGLNRNKMLSEKEK